MQTIKSMLAYEKLVEKRIENHKNVKSRLQKGVSILD